MSLFGIKTTFSVFIRILLWLIMLIGGSYISISHDIVSHTWLFYNMTFHIFSFIFGVILMRLAFHAAACGGRELAKRGRDKDLPRLETDKLVTSGIYAYMRHPMLFGLMLIPLTLAFLLGSPTFIMLVAPLEMLFIAFMVLIFEEMECKKKFGMDYKKYSNEVPMVCLKKECLQKLFILKIKKEND